VVRVRETCSPRPVAPGFRCSTSWPANSIGCPASEVRESGCAHESGRLMKRQIDFGLIAARGTRGA
jgi:hypothetical protein